MGTRRQRAAVPGSEAGRRARVPWTSPSSTAPSPTRSRPTNLLGYPRTTTHTDIAALCGVASFGCFLFAGTLAELTRAELARPGPRHLSSEQGNQLFTIHGTLMPLLFATPLASANFLVPSRTSAPDVAFPRLNALSFWLFPFGGPTITAGFLTPNGAAGLAGSPRAAEQRGVLRDRRALHRGVGAPPVRHGPPGGASTSRGRSDHRAGLITKGWSPTPGWRWSCSGGTPASPRARARGLGRCGRSRRME
jgi:Cytochrome C and Quinol oxidase polypeptide I